MCNYIGENGGITDYLFLEGCKAFLARWGNPDFEDMQRSKLVLR